MSHPTPTTKSTQTASTSRSPIVASAVESISSRISETDEPGFEIPRPQTPALLQKHNQNPKPKLKLQSLRFPKPILPFTYATTSSLRNTITDTNTYGGNIQTVHPVISLRSLRSIALSINPFSSPSPSLISRDNFWTSRMLGSTFASQDGASNHTSHRGSITSQLPAQIEGTSRDKNRNEGMRKGRNRRAQICGLKNTTALWLCLAVAEAGIMSFMAAIGVVAADLKRGIRLGVIAWLGLSAVTAILALAGGLLLYIGSTNRRLRLRFERPNAKKFSAAAEGERDDVGGHFEQDLEGGGYVRSENEDRKVGEEVEEANGGVEKDRNDSSVRRRRAQNDNDVDILTIRTRTSDHKSSSLRQLQDIIDRDTNAYVESDSHSPSPRSSSNPTRSNGTSSLRTSSLTSVTSPVENPFLRHGSYRMHPSSSANDLNRLPNLNLNQIFPRTRAGRGRSLRVAQTVEQEQAYLEMRRQHFAALNRNHFLGLDHPILDGLAPRRDEEEEGTNGDAGGRTLRNI